MVPIFGDKAHAPAQNIDGRAIAYAFAIQDDIPVCDRPKSDDRLCKFPLPIAFNTGNAKNLARLKRQIETAQCINAAIASRGNAVEIKNGLARGHLAARQMGVTAMSYHRGYEGIGIGVGCLPGANHVSGSHDADPVADLYGFSKLVCDDENAEALSR